MIFCRVDNPCEGIIYGEGLTVELAYEDAQNHANYEFSTQGEITFWEANKMSVSVSFEPKFTKG